MQLREPYESCSLALHRALLLARVNGLKLVKTQLTLCKDNVFNLVVELFQKNDSISGLTKEYDSTSDSIKMSELDKQLDTLSTDRQSLLEKVMTNLGTVLNAVTDMKYGAFLKPDLTCVVSTLTQMRLVISAVGDFDAVPSTTASTPPAESATRSRTTAPAPPPTVTSLSPGFVGDTAMSGSGQVDSIRGRSRVRDREHCSERQRREQVCLVLLFIGLYDQTCPISMEFIMPVHAVVLVVVAQVEQQHWYC